MDAMQVNFSSDKIREKLEREGITFRARPLPDGRVGFVVFGKSGSALDFIEPVDPAAHGAADTAESIDVILARIINDFEITYECMPILQSVYDGVDFYPDDKVVCGNCGCVLADAPNGIARRVRYKSCPRCGFDFVWR